VLCIPRADIGQDSELGFQLISAPDLDQLCVAAVVERIRHRVEDRPVYVSMDIDVLDPARAPRRRHPRGGRPVQPGTAGYAAGPLPG